MELEKALKIPLALRKGRLVSPQECPSGINEDALCLECQEPLLKRSGPKTRAHFSHLPNSQSQCRLETIIHTAAKILLQNAQTIWLPKENTETPLGRNHETNQEFYNQDKVWKELLDATINQNKGPNPWILASPQNVIISKSWCEISLKKILEDYGVPKTSKPQNPQSPQNLRGQSVIPDITLEIINKDNNDQRIHLVAKRNPTHLLAF